MLVLLTLHALSRLTKIYHCRYKEAVNECTAALEAQPGYHKALTRRAKAYEQMGHYKQALSDVQKANKGSEATPETQVCCDIGLLEMPCRLL